MYIVNDIVANFFLSPSVFFFHKQLQNNNFFMSLYSKLRGEHKNTGR